MAAVTLIRESVSTANATSYATPSFTPTANALLVAFVNASAMVGFGTMTDSQGLGFTEVRRALLNTSAWTLLLFVANRFAAASAMTATFDCTGDTAAGAQIGIVQATGMSKFGGAAIRQSAIAQNGAAAGTPAATFTDAAALTENATVAGCGNLSNPAGLTPPASWTERTDIGSLTPDQGIEVASRDTGFTGTTITWASTSATAWGAIIAELDTGLPISDLTTLPWRPTP